LGIKIDSSYLGELNLAIKIFVLKKLILKRKSKAV